MEGHNKLFELATDERVYFKLVYKSNATGEYSFDLADVANTNGSLEVFRESIRTECMLWDCLCFREKLSKSDYLKLLDMDLKDLSHSQIGGFFEDFKPRWDNEQQSILGFK